MGARPCSRLGDAAVNKTWCAHSFVVGVLLRCEWRTAECLSVWHSDLTYRYCKVMESIVS